MSSAWQESVKRLRCKASDKDIRARFTDGIQYMSLGQDTTVQAAIEELARAMRTTGATVSAAAVENSTSLKRQLLTRLPCLKARSVYFSLTTCGRLRSVPRVS